MEAPLNYEIYSLALFFSALAIACVVRLPRPALASPGDTECPNSAESLLSSNEVTISPRHVSYEAALAFPALRADVSCVQVARVLRNRAQSLRM